MDKSKKILDIINPPFDMSTFDDVEKLLADKECYSLCLRSTFHFVNQTLIEIFEKNIQGDIVLAGVWRGGLAAYIQNILIEYKQDHRKLFLADTFSGFVDVSNDHQKDKKMLEYFSTLDAPVGSRKEVEQLFNKLELHCENVVFMEGDIKVTSEGFNNPISFMLLDMDFYYPTFYGLNNLYPCLVNNGIIYIDDYNADVYECKDAVTDYLNRHNLSPTINVVNQFAISWIK